jgi:hypothetical protein
MPATRTFNIIFVDQDHGAGGDVTATADQSVTYDGFETKVNAS